MTPTERRVAAIYAVVLELRAVHADDDLHTLASDSLQVVRIALEIELEFQISVPLEAIERSTRVRDVASWVDARVASAVAGGRG